MSHTSWWVLALVAAPGLAAQPTPTTTAPPGRTYRVTVIDSAQLHSVPSGTPIAALVGKVPGGRVVAASNEPGTVPTIYLRGAMADRDGEPLIVIDGEVSALSLADITTNDVERIEIVHGAVGGSTYGARGGNGVVLITRRRAPSSYVIANSDVAQTSVKHLRTSPRHAFQLDANGNFVLGTTGNRLAEPDDIQDNPYPAYFDLSRSVLRPRSVFSNYIAGGRHLLEGRTRVAASASDEQDKGVIALLDGYSRTTGRFVLDQAITSRVDVSVDAFGARSSDNDPALGSPFAQLIMVEPHVGPDSASASNPLYGLRAVDSRWRRERSGWRVGGEYRPRSWVWLRAATSRDRAREHSAQDFPSGLRFADNQPPTANPSWSRYDATQRHAVTSASLGGRRSFRQDFVRAVGQFTFTDDTYRVSSREADSVSSTVFSETGSSSIQRVQGYSFGLTADIGDRVVLDAHLRKDLQLLYGAGRSHWYHRIAGAYTLGATRVHAAHGTAGGNDINILLSGLLGVCPIFQPCPTLRKPRVHELELGVDHQFRGRYDGGYTLSHRRMAGVVGAALLPPSVGGGGAVLANIGDAVAFTHEINAAARLVSTPGLAWDVNVVAHRMRARMKNMVQPPAYFGPPGSNTILFRFADGETIGTIWGVQAIRTEAQLLETIRVGQLTGTAADYVLNEDGYYVRAIDYHTRNERPLLAYRCAPATGPCQSIEGFARIGDANPDLDLGINSTVRWNAFTAYATVSAVLGGDIYNGARRNAFFAGRDPVIDQSARPAAERKPVGYYRAFASMGPNELFIEDGSFLRLSELAVDWRLPLRHPVRAGVVGRNLFTRSRYSGYDPDAAAGALVMFGYRVDMGAHPAYRTLGIRVRLGD